MSSERFVRLLPIIFLDRAMVESMGMAKSTYQEHKAKTLKEMSKKLRDYK